MNVKERVPRKLSLQVFLFGVFKRLQKTVDETSDRIIFDINFYHQSRIFCALIIKFLRKSQFQTYPS